MSGPFIIKPMVMMCGNKLSWSWHKKVKLPEGEKGDPEGTLQVYAEFVNKEDAYPGGKCGWVRVEVTWKHRGHRKKKAKEGYFIPMSDFDEETIQELAYAIREAGLWVSSVVSDEFELETRYVEAEENEWIISSLNNATKRQHRFELDVTNPPGSRYIDRLKVYSDLTIRSDDGRLATFEFRTIHQYKGPRQKNIRNHPNLHISDLMAEEDKECILGAIRGGAKWAYTQLMMEGGA
jgi:hypothetical protein